MPIIKIFATHPPGAQVCTALADELEAICISVMQARADTVQVLLSGSTVMLKGAPVLVEAHYRAGAQRDAAALARFMDGIEGACRRWLGETPRIRCFAVEPAALSARH
ncbi:hypothetical protein [Verminephrobacter aporrectodeae]|uniref:hypothetical protein n=1 Tax=Verminephrobacter aporrectodeae TaxID=1110389 RepID=UPI00224382E8|nr:hypothetical protein [Verminephrobacter aporrectodeae]